MQVAPTSMFAAREALDRQRLLFEVGAALHC